MELPYYHGGISKQDGENLLIQEGKDGSYLLRDSETVEEALCLCILFGKLIYTYRIFQDGNGFYKIACAEGVKEMAFKEVRDLIVHYEKHNCGLVHSLLYPVNKETLFRVPAQPGSSMKRIVEINEMYAEVDEREYVEVLPS
ncbi:SH2 domain-containing protein 1B-like [Discoglossus pictus]